MIDSILANDSSELEKMKILSKSKNLFKNGIIDGDQWNTIKEDYKTRIYSPSLFIKLPLFVISTLGLLFGFGLLFLIVFLFDFLDLDEQDGIALIRILALFGGLTLIFLTEIILIKTSSHFNSGITEAGIYSGFSLMVFGLFGFEDIGALYYLITAFLCTAFVTIRYLDSIALIAAIMSLGGIVFTLAFMIGGLIEALLPFILMGVFGGLYFLSNMLQEKMPSAVFENHFIITKALSLLFIYLAGNYFIVRELSIELMGLNLSENQDIPFAFLFYIFTISIPALYIYLGVTKKSLILIRIGFLTSFLTGLTFYHYYLTDYTVYVVTLIGACLMTLSIFLFKRLKSNVIGFTSEKLMDDSWSTKEITSIMASRMIKEDSYTDTKKNW